MDATAGRAGRAIPHRGRSTAMHAGRSMRSILQSHPVSSHRMLFIVPSSM